jgi:hypothetical protein
MRPQLLTVSGFTTDNLQSSLKKRRFTQDLQGATSQKTAFFIVTAVKTSNITIIFNYKPILHHSYVPQCVSCRLPCTAETDYPSADSNKTSQHQISLNLFSGSRFVSCVQTDGRCSLDRCSAGLGRRLKIKHVRVYISHDDNAETFDV